ncbi:MAG: ABC transporter permease subunit [Chloroflexia bacterium]
MDSSKIKLVLRKEWLQLKQQRGLVLTTALLPFLFTLMPIGIIFAIGAAPTKGINGIDSLLDLARQNPSLASLSLNELLQAAIGTPLSGILLILPVLLPSIIASYSVVGEKVSGTLEPVLATPITTFEFLFAKILTALIPSVGITWFFGLLYVMGLYFVTLSHNVFFAIINLSWFILFIVCAPLLSLSAIAVTVAASSRATDPRTAQQISAIVIIPVVLVIAGQFTGLIILSPIFSVILAIVLALLAVLTIWIATRVFAREAILTRWS